MIIGVDVGYTYTKFCTETNEDIFRSTVEEGAKEINKESIIVEYEGKQFTVGDKGAYSVDLNKIEDRTFKICLITAIAQAMKYNAEEINLVTGLPIDYYSKQKLILKNSLENKDVFIKYQGESKVFTINKCLVFPQSAGLIALEPDRFKGDNLVIDIGGMTVDVAYFEGLKLVKHRTYPLGMLKVYGKVIQYLNSNYETNYDDVLDAEKVMRDGLFIDEKKIDVDFSSILKPHAEDIHRPIKLEFPFKTSKKTYIGGGALALKDYILGEVKKDNIYANARAFHEIGCEKFDN